MSTNNNTCAIYVRVSQQKKNKEKYSIPAQIRILTDYAKMKKWDIFEIYNENEKKRDASGETIAKRPKLLKLLEDAKLKQFNYCLVIDLDRLSRSEDLFDWLAIEKVFCDNEIQIITPSHRFDLSDEDDAFLFLLFAQVIKLKERISACKCCAVN